MTALEERKTELLEEYEINPDRRSTIKRQIKVLEMGASAKEYIPNYHKKEENKNVEEDVQNELFKETKNHKKTVWLGRLDRFFVAFSHNAGPIRIGHPTAREH